VNCCFYSVNGKETITSFQIGKVSSGLLSGADIVEVLNLENDVHQSCANGGVNQVQSNFAAITAKWNNNELVCYGTSSYSFSPPLIRLS
jgi:hypothetical protein